MPFLPGIVCLPLWAYLMTEKGIWAEAFAGYYPMSLAMIVGCLIAGSTPLGGAVVAFPVAVLVIKFKPVQGRDFAVLIQSVGMTAAAYLIATKKSEMVHAYLVRTSCVANTIGVILGFCIALPGFWVNVTYMTYMVVFAGILFYKHTAVAKIGVAALQPKVHNDDNSWCTILTTFGLFLSGIIGGVLASKLGSGSDTMAYVFGVFVYNPLFAKKGMAIAESSLTASSVVIMAYTSIVITVIRLVQGDVDREVFLCWGAVLWIVVFGAPIGSLVLSPQRETFFRRLFYVLALVQFATFAVLKIKANAIAWLVIGITVLAAILGISAHAFFIQTPAKLNTDTAASIQNPTGEKQLSEMESEASTGAEADEQTSKSSCNTSDENSASPPVVLETV